MGNKKQKAFTLAEVLLTLVVIGIVASLTIPVLINNINQRSRIVALKEANRILSGAVQRIKTDNGGTLAGLFSGSGDIQNAFGNYIGTLKKCQTGTGNCWSNTTVGFDNGDITSSWHFSTYPSSTILNGMNISFLYTHGSSACTSTWIGSGTEVPAGGVCALIVVDINGNKSPNMLGADVFDFWLFRDRIVPCGSYIDKWSDPSIMCTASDQGRGCTAKYLKNDY